MNTRRRAVGRVLVLGCALSVAALASQSAQAGPKPEAPPQSHSGSSSPQPAPSPSTSGQSSTTSTAAHTTVSTHVSTSVSSSTRSVQQTPATAVVRRASTPRGSRPAQHREPALRAPAKLGGWPVGLHAAAGLSLLRSVESPSSASSSLLFAAGIALLLIVIAEASFLRLAAPRIGVAGARAPVRRRTADEPLAIRPVQLRR